MTAGDVLLDRAGNRMLDADGNVVLSDGAGDGCCCCPCGPFVRAVFNGLAAPASRTFGSGDDAFTVEVVGQFASGPYVLGESGSNGCNWYVDSRSYEPAFVRIASADGSRSSCSRRVLITIIQRTDDLTQFQLEATLGDVGISSTTFRLFSAVFTWTGGAITLPNDINEIGGTVTLSCDPGPIAVPVGGPGGTCSPPASGFYCVRSAFARSFCSMDPQFTQYGEAPRQIFEYPDEAAAVAGLTAQFPHLNAGWQFIGKLTTEVAQPDGWENTVGSWLDYITYEEAIDTDLCRGAEVDGNNQRWDDPHVPNRTAYFRDDPFDSWANKDVFGRVPSPFVHCGGGPATGPATGPGTGPATGPGTGPATGPGTGPATGPGTGPATGPGTGPATGPGTGPATGPGTGPATGPGTGPGGTGPATGPGGTGPATGPATGPGGTGPSTGPTTGPATGPASGDGHKCLNCNGCCTSSVSEKLSLFTADNAESGERLAIAACMSGTFSPILDNGYAIGWTGDLTYYGDGSQRVHAEVLCGVGSPILVFKEQHFTGDGTDLEHDDPGYGVPYDYWASVGGFGYNADTTPDDNNCRRFRGHISAPDAPAGYLQITTTNNICCKLSNGTCATEGSPDDSGDCPEVNA